ncbi:serine protease inhibitor [Augochlora pura]
MKSYAFAAVFLVVVARLETTATFLYKPEAIDVKTCGPNEVYSSCAGNPKCEKSCDNIDTWDSVGCAYQAECVAGCVCGEGFVRDANRVCVWANRCPRVRH